MIRVAISVEGQTEDEFCKNILVPYLRSKNIELTPIIVSTSRNSCGKKSRGGCINLDRVKNEVSKLLNSFDFVTTFYDYYAFGGISNINSIEELESEMYKLLNNSKYIPYIQKYEFETLLFADTNYYSELLSPKATIEMNDIVNRYNGNIESINNSKETAPSKRIEKIFTENNELYDKVFYGYSIIEDIGIAKIKEKSPRFNSWLKTIEQLGI